MRNSSHNRERGIALPFVLVVTLSLVVLVGDLGLRAQLTFDRSRRALRMAEARSLLNKIEESIGGLGADEMEKLAKDDVEFDVDDFQVSLSVDHTESKLNIGRLDDLISLEQHMKRDIHIVDDVIRRRRMQLAPDGEQGTVRPHNGARM